MPRQRKKRGGMLIGEGICTSTWKKLPSVPNENVRGKFLQTVRVVDLKSRSRRRMHWTGFQVMNGRLHENREIGNPLTRGI